MTPEQIVDAFGQFTDRPGGTRARRREGASRELNPEPMCRQTYALRSENAIHTRNPCPIPRTHVNIPPSKGVAASTYRNKNA